MVNFNPRYLVADPLRAKCGSSIRIEIIDRATNLPFEEDVPGLKLEVYLIDGHHYDTQQVERMRMGLEGGTETEEELLSCAHFMNKKKTEALLICPSGSASNNSQLKIIIPFNVSEIIPLLPSVSLLISSCL